MNESERDADGVEPETPAPSGSPTDPARRVTLGKLAYAAPVVAAVVVSKPADAFQPPPPPGVPGAS